MRLALPMIAVTGGLLLPALGRCADVPRPEHPRPDSRRAQWLNLNGVWDFEIDRTGDAEKRGLTEGKPFAGRITVPFCPESKLSGVGETDFMSDVWYRRRFTVPGSWSGRRLLLHFGAVDWHARVWLNGRYLGSHKGGYSPFRFEVTNRVRSGSNEIVVHAHDETRSGLQATGKQAHSRNSEGCVYTRTTGIWQTVWLEAVGTTYVRSFSITPDLDAGRALVNAWVDGPLTGAKLRVQALAQGKVVGQETVTAAWRGTTAVVKLARVTPWHPGKPFLYDLRLEVVKGGKVLDSVTGYFGLRKITIDGNRFLINDKPVFQRLVLDQGFYPDGIYTARTDADLRRDIELSMAAGFNGARLHQKVFEPRTLYWADKLGYMVWGEYPSWGVDLARPSALGVVLDEWRTIVDRDRNHPSIVGWCPLNETGGGEVVASAQAALAVSQAMDPTRPYLDTSGYVHLYPDTDIYDTHDYDQNPEAYAARYSSFSMTGMRPWNNNPTDPRSTYGGQPFFVSEYGGIRLATARDVGVAGWGYGSTDMKQFVERYKGLTDAMLDNPNMFAFCYTQLTDVEQEQNGVFYYDRKPKYDPKILRAINARPAAYETSPPRVQRVDWRAIAPTSQAHGQTWRYTLAEPGKEWAEPDFDASTWMEGIGGFGRPDTPGAVIRTEWLTPDIWLRRTFQSDRVVGEMLALVIHHDEDAEVYINGARVAQLPGYTSGYTEILATAKIVGALRPGENTLAVHCHQTEGGQYIDLGIAAGRPAKSAK